MGSFVPLPLRQHSLGLLLWMLALSVLAGDRLEGSLEVNKETFNPTAGETLQLRIGGDEIKDARLLVYDPDGGLIRSLSVPAGATGVQSEVIWDGRDDDGRVIPDEAYTLVAETDDGVVFDPASESGGEVQDIRDPTFDDTGAVSYRLPAPSRVLIRLGIRNGPMYRTLVDWEPRPAGQVTEYWDGYDADGLVRLRGREAFTALITYVTLPEATVITYGNDTETYRSYKLGRGKDRPQKPERPVDAETAKRFRPESLVPPAWARAPRVEMAFPDFPNGDAIPAVERFVKVRINVAEEDKPLLMEDQFEVLLFVDGQFFAEAERGYLPLNWKWELNQFSPGEHVLTANIASFRGQVGVASRKIRLEP